MEICGSISCVLGLLGIVLFLQSLLGSCKPHHDLLFADYLTDLTNRRPHWVASHRIAEQEEHVFVFKRPLVLGVLFKQVKRADLVKDLSVKRSRVGLGDLHLEVSENILVGQLRLLQLQEKVLAKLCLVIRHLKEVTVILDVADVPHPDRHEVHNL